MFYVALSPNLGSPGQQSKTCKPITHTHTQAGTHATHGGKIPSLPLLGQLAIPNQSTCFQCCLLHLSSSQSGSSPFPSPPCSFAVSSPPPIWLMQRQGAASTRFLPACLLDGSRSFHCSLLGCLPALLVWPQLLLLCLPACPDHCRGSSGSLLLLWPACLVGSAYSSRYLHLFLYVVHTNADNIPIHFLFFYIFLQTWGSHPGLEKVCTPYLNLILNRKEHQ